MARTRARKREFKAFTNAEFKVLDADQGIGEFYVSVYGVKDSMNEVVDYGAYGKSLGTKLPKGVWSHDWETPVAKTLEAEEVRPGDARLSTKIKEFGGLRIKAQFNMETQRGSEAFSDVKGGYIDEFSIGYEVPSDYMQDGTRHLKEIRLYEWSPVLVGANPMTETVSAKALAAPLPETEEESAVLCSATVGSMKTDTGDDAPLVCGEAASAHPTAKCKAFKTTIDPIGDIVLSVSTVDPKAARTFTVSPELRGIARAVLVAAMAEKGLQDDVDAARPWDEVVLIVTCFYNALENIMYTNSGIDDIRLSVAALAQELIEIMSDTTVSVESASNLPADPEQPVVDPIIYSDSAPLDRHAKEGRILSDSNYKHIAAARDNLADVITAHETAMANRQTVEGSTEEATEVATSKAGAKRAGTEAVDGTESKAVLERIEAVETRLIGTITEISSNLRRLGIVLPK